MQKSRNCKNIDTPPRQGYGKAQQKGQTLFEMIVVLGIAVLVISGILTAVITSVSNATFAKTQTQASRYAQESIEWIRQERDRDWTAFFSHSGSTYCLQILSWNVVGGCVPGAVIQGTNFRREVTLTTQDTNTIQVDVKVKWDDAHGTHSSNLTTILTKWQ